MALEFHKLTNQVDEMTTYLAAQEIDVESRVVIALKILAAYADPAYLPEIHERVQDAIDKDAGYRGARPYDHEESIMGNYPPADLPESATLIATDGSQIYPRSHDAMQFYLLNIASIAFHHGSGGPPDIQSHPTLFYENEKLRPDGPLIKTNVVDARRTVAEMTALAEQALIHRGEARPLIALLDGPLLFVMGNEIPDRRQLRELYFMAMKDLKANKAALTGYTDNPKSTFLIRLLHLLDISAEEVSRSTLSNSGRLETLFDVKLFQHPLEGGGYLLPSGHRSAIFVQMSPQNKEFKQRGGEQLEIAFFYINVAAEGEFPHIARVDLPIWVIENRDLVGELQALIYAQCQQIMQRYPYVLMRADELAVVKADEKRQFMTMIKVAMTRQGMSTAESAKQASKNVARGKKSRFEMRK